MGFSQREARSIVRKQVKRVPEGEEIRHLNIMPMMDMMTILLVAFISQLATSATEMTAASVSLPKSPTDEELPETSSTLVIAKTGIVVEGKQIVAISNGRVDASEKPKGTEGYKIPKLSNFLGALRREVEAKHKPDGKPQQPPELLIIADRTTPYSLLIEVMFSAKEKEAGYKRFRLIVEKQFPVTPDRR